MRGFSVYLVSSDRKLSWKYLFHQQIPDIRTHFPPPVDEPYRCEVLTQLLELRRTQRAEFESKNIPV